MAKTFAEVVKELKALVPELRYMSVHVRSPLAAQLGPCFLPVPANQLPRVSGWLGGLLGLEELPDAEPGIHLPARLDWLAEQEEVFMASALASAREAAGDDWSLCEEEVRWELAKLATELFESQRDALAEVLVRAGLRPTTRMLARFAVLHELGHARQWVRLGGDVYRWVRSLFRDRLGLLRGLAGRDPDDALNMLLGPGYRAQALEAEADAFAVRTLRRFFGPGVRRFLDPARCGRRFRMKEVKADVA